jgi:hypothetical protein
MLGISADDAVPDEPADVPLDVPDLSFTGPF